MCSTHRATPLPSRSREPARLAAARTSSPCRRAGAAGQERIEQGLLIIVHHSTGCREVAYHGKLDHPIVLCYLNNYHCVELGSVSDAMG